MAANTIPTVSTLPPAPTRADAPADFTTKADAFVASLPPLVNQVNGTVTAMNSLGSYLDQLKTDTIKATGDNATAAANSAKSASDSAAASSTSANQASGFRDSAQAAAAAAQSSAGLPAISGKADYMLSVNAAGNGVEYRVSVPRPTASAAGKVARVNSAGNAYELADGSPISKYFESTQQTVVSDGYTTVTHGFGAVPKFVSAHLICKVAVAGYAVGDRVEIVASSVFASPTAGTNGRPNMIQLTCDQTTIYVKQTNQINIPYKSAVSSADNYLAVNSTNFALVVRAAA